MAVVNGIVDDDGDDDNDINKFQWNYLAILATVFVFVYMVRLIL
ncbi:unnamed protein product [Gongylonema pulchrum]|uniref:Preprotein translocase subunit Sec61beta n=1 Tax=Gongylonema pulchrum TaxID=637853 RepID=A0A183DIS2_9BILA|nr:unnamed protein product [Gongylonema pulchrum]